MSVESFFNKYGRASNVKERMAKERLFNRSSIATFALNLAKEAGEGLREHTGNLGHSDVAFTFDAESLLSLPQDVRKKLRTNHVGVIFGVSIPPLEQSCIAGYYDLEEWCSLYNIAISGTPFSQMKAEEGKSREVLSIKHLQDLREVVKKDPTFATLFAENVKFVPESLKSILTNSGILPIIQQDILPFYIPNAKLLVAP